MKRVFLVFIFLSTHLYCADLVITSSPQEVDIYVLTKGKKARKLGKTPYKSTVEEVIGDQEKVVSHIILKKDGFQQQRFVLTAMGQNDIEIETKMKAKDGIKQVQGYDRLINDLFTVQRLIRNRSYDEALKVLEEKEKKYPNVSAISEMKGSVYYLKNDYNKSLAMYREAFGKNTKNFVAYKMKTYLEKKLGIESAK